MKDTRTALLEAAADLFFEKGMENTSIREIVSRAGQSNASALHYHFGSRTGLLTALIPYGAKDIEVVRERMVNELKADHKEDDLLSLIHAHAYPLIEVAANKPNSVRHLSILVQVINTPNLDINEVLFLASPEHAQWIINKVIECLKPTLPMPLIAYRMAVQRGLFGTLASEIVQQQRRIGIASLEQLEPLLTHYVHLTELLLTAPTPPGPYPDVEFLNL